jgi:hypothetical protein
MLLLIVDLNLYLSIKNKNHSLTYYLERKGGDPALVGEGTYERSLKRKKKKDAQKKGICPQARVDQYYLP